MTDKLKCPDCGKKSIVAINVLPALPKKKIEKHFVATWSCGNCWYYLQSSDHNAFTKLTADRLDTFVDWWNGNCTHSQVCTKIDKDKIILSRGELEEIVEKAFMLGMITPCAPTDEIVEKGVRYVMDSIDSPAANSGA